MNTAPALYESSPVTCHNRKLRQSESGRPELATYIKRCVPIPAVVRNGVWAIPVTRRCVITAYALVDAEDAPLLEQYRWQIIDRRAQGWPSYAVRVEGERAERTIPMHRQLMGLKRGERLVVDHINHDWLDNRKANLRVCTRAENMQNRRGPQARA